LVKVVCILSKIFNQETPRISRHPIIGKLCSLAQGSLSLDNFNFLQIFT